MKAMVLENPGEKLTLQNVPKPSPSSKQVLIKISCCGVCRTDLHILDGDLDNPNLPLIPGHQIIGTVEEIGSEVERFNTGDKVGVPWLGETCGHCEFCRNDRENLCNHSKFTGYDLNGGFAEYTAADAQYCFSIPKDYADQQAAPLLCAGLIGYRSLRKTKEAQKIGFYGFGSSAHILTQAAVYQSREVFAFTRPGDREGQQFALDMGAVWAGASNEPPPQKLDAAIIFAPVGPLIPEALKNIKKGGTVVCAGIHMSDIPEFSYDLLWGERVIESVANLTRQDGEEFLELAPKIPIKTSVTTYPLKDANEALYDLREGNFEGSAVLEIS
jgi:propanol-preferring alcohol dehydrogenase